jgi:membrane protein YqaA with SNARE-associated domain
MSKRHTVLTVFVIVGFIALWSVLLHFYPPKEIVAAFGTENVLVVAFLISASSGVSTVASVNYYATVLALAAGGTNPVAISIVAGTGITVGDSLYYYLGRRGHDLLSGKPLQWAKKAERWIRDQHETWVQIGAYIYTGLTPLPNDLLTVSLGLAEYSYRRLLPAIFLGNITLTIIIAEFASHVEFIRNIFI